MYKKSINLRSKLRNTQFNVKNIRALIHTILEISICSDIIMTIRI